MNTKNIYENPVLLAYGFKVDQMARGTLTISDSGRVEIKLNDGTLLLSAPLKLCKLSFSIDNSWHITVDGRSFSIVTLQAMDEKVQLVGSLRYRRWAHQDRSNIEPDKTMEELFKNPARFPEDSALPIVAKNYEPIPGLRRITFALIATGAISLIAITVLAFLGFTTPPKVTKPTQVIVVVIILLITSLRIYYLFKQLNTAAKNK